MSVGLDIGQRVAAKWKDKESLEYAYICESIATVYHRRGYYQSALDKFETALRIREESKETSLKVLADSHSAVGLALYGMFRSEESIKAVKRAYQIASEAHPADRRLFNMDRYLRNLSRPKVFLGHYEDAKKDLDEAEAFQNLVYGQNSRFHGEYDADVSTMFRSVAVLTTLQNHLHSCGHRQKARRPRSRRQTIHGSSSTDSETSTSRPAGCSRTISPRIDIL